MDRTIHKPKTDVYVVALVKGDERYIAIYDRYSASAAIRTLGRWAANPELSFNWFNAAMLTQKIRRECK